MHTLSVHGFRWCADSWDTMEQSELPLMQSLAKAQEPSGWIMWLVLVQSHPWTDVPSMDGASTTVDIVKMQEWCAKVLIVHMSSIVMIFFIIYIHSLFYVLTIAPSSFYPPIKHLCNQLLLYVWWEAPPLTVVVWRCSTMESGVQCVMTTGTSRMPL